MKLTTRTSLWILLFAVGVFWSIFWRQRHQPALGTDSLIYHLTIPAHWTQSGFFASLDLPFHDGASENGPLFTETISYFFMKLTGDDGLTPFIQPAFFLLLLYVFYRTSREMGLPKEIALPLTALLALFRPFVNSSQIVNNEMVLACGCALALHGIVRMKRTLHHSLLLVCVGVALMAGTKYVGVIYGGIFLLWALTGLMQTLRRGEADAGFSWLKVGGVCVLLLLLGSGTYLRNLLQHGNPVYPAEVRLGSLTIFRGLYSTRCLMDHGWSWPAIRTMFFHHQDQFALTWSESLLLWPMAFVPLVSLAHPRLRPFSGAALLFPASIFPLMVPVIHLALIPFWEQHRLLYPMYYGLWLGAACTLRLAHGLLGERHSSWLSWGLCAFFLVRFILGGLWVLPWMLGIAVFTAILAFVPWPAEKARRYGPVAVGVVVVTAIGVSVLSYPAYRDGRRDQRQAAYLNRYGSMGKAWSLVDSLSERQDDLTVAYTGSSLVYPLFGPRLRNRVVYVPVSENDVPSPVAVSRKEDFFPTLHHQRREGADEAYWLAGLQSADADFIYVVDRKDDGIELPELQFIASHPARFAAVLREGEVSLFAVRR